MSDVDLAAVPVFSDPVPASPRAAGVLFVDPAKRVFLVRRGAGADHPGDWSVPGGMVEAGETAEIAAVRECFEEIGACPAGERAELTRRDRDGIDYTTFIQRVDEPFVAKLNDESCDSGWFALEALPTPLHPGTRVTLDRLGWNELDVARAIRDGELTSPQFFVNVWLFAMRVTGTGAAYRKINGGEYAWRDPGVYLSDEFLARCNGLQVIYEHPPGSTLDSDEFRDRVVGSIFLPYIAGEEVWGIAKVYDEDAAAIMRNMRMSTSPAVVLRPGGKTSALEDGSTLLIEGEPMLLDHLAICEQGVWDKGQDPVGVISTSGDEAMADEEDKTEVRDDARKDGDDTQARDDADAGSMPDKLLSKIDAMCDSVSGVADAVSKLSSRLDAMEEREAKADKARKDGAKKDDEPSEDEARELAADKARKDEADKKEEEARADAARRDGEIKDLRTKLDEVTAAVPKAMSDADFKEMADAQAKADGVFAGFGKSAPRPLQGETVTAYRRRAATELRSHSARWKGEDLYKVSDSVLNIAEADIYADAAAAALHPTDLGEDELREIVHTDHSTGRRSSTFVGRGTFVSQIRRPPVRATLQTARK